MNKKFLIYLIFFLFLFGCSEKPISEKQRAINAYKEKQNKKYVRDSKESIICVVSNTTPEIFHRTLKVSPDSQKIAYLGQDFQQNQFFLRVNNQRQISYYDIGPDSILFSPDSRHIAYIAMEKVNSEKKHFIVKDNIKVSKYYDTTSKNGVIFSPDSKNIAYTVKEDGQWKVIVDGWGVEYPAFDSALTNTVKFSPDSKTLVYGARKGDQCFIVVNGVPQKFYEGISSVILSKDNLAYIGVDENNQSVVLNNKEQKRYGLVSSKSLIFSLDGKHLAYGVEEDGKQFVILDEIEQKKYDFILESSLIFSPDGEHLVYIAISEEENFIVLDGEELVHYPTRGYIKEGSGVKISLNDETIVFSPNSQYFAYGVITQLSQFMVLDGVEQEEYKGLIENSMVFSPDSQHFGYLAVGYDNKLLAVVDGKEYPINEGEAAKFCFSPDSKHFAYIVRDEGRWSVVVDGEAGKYYPNLLLDERKTLFNEDGSFHYLIMRDKKIYLVEEELVENQP